MNTALARKVYVAGNPTPYEFAPGNYTDAALLTAIRQYDASVPADATLVWQERTEDGANVLVATIVPRAQTKG